MIRYCILIWVLLGADIALSQSLTSDAFGLFVGEDTSRENWSGLRVRCEADGCDFMDFEPSEAFTVDQFFGQKSLVVNEQTAMSMALVTDIHGNLVREGEVTSQIEDGAVRRNSEIKHGLSVQTFLAGKRVDRFYASSFTNDRQSLAELYRTIPDIASIRPELAPIDKNISQGKLVELQTSPLRDQYQNQAPIGFLMSGFTRSQTGLFGFFPIATQDDVARLYIDTNNFNGRHDIWVETSQQKGRRQILDIQPARIVGVRGIEAKFSPDTRLLSFRLSSIVTSQDHLIEDARRLNLRVVEANGREQEEILWTLEGAVEGRLALGEDALPLTLYLGDGASQVQLTLDDTLLASRP